MSENKISAAMTPADITDISSSVGDVETKMPFLLNLGKDDRHDLRKMGGGRKGYVDAVYVAANQFSDMLPANFKMPEFKKDMELHDALSMVKAMIVSRLIEKVDDTLMQLGSELMAQADHAYSLLKVAGQKDKENSAVKEALALIGEETKAQGNRSEPIVLIVPTGGSVIVKQVVPGLRFVNLGETTLSLDIEPEITGVPRPPAIKVLPGNWEVIPPGCKAIMVKNEGTDKEGCFSVRIKK